MTDLFSLKDRAALALRLAEDSFVLSAIAPGAFVFDTTRVARDHAR